MTWILVALGGAAGTALGWYVLRRGSARRLAAGTAAISALMGALAGYPYPPAVVVALVGFGVLGSAASMVAVSAVSPDDIDDTATGTNVGAVTKRLLVYCAIAVVFALAGYLAAKGGSKLFVKLV